MVKEDVLTIMKTLIEETLDEIKDEGYNDFIKGEMLAYIDVLEMMQDFGGKDFDIDYSLLEDEKVNSK